MESMKNTRPDIASLAEALEDAKPRPRQPVKWDSTELDATATEDIYGRPKTGPHLLAASLEQEFREKDARNAEHERAEAERAHGA